MKFTLKRIAALMMAVMMLLGVTSSFAQDVYTDTRTQVLDSGKNIATQMQIELDQLTLTSILNMFGMAGEADEQGQQVVLDSLFGALNKLKMNSLQSLTAAYVTVGTDKGELMDFYADTNIQAGEGYLTTSLMPNVKFSLPKEMLGSYASIALSHNMEMITSWFAPYKLVFDQFSGKQLAEKAKVEDGSFEVIDQGSFDSKSSLEVDTHLIAALLEEFLPLIKEDKIIADHIALISDSGLAKSNDMSLSLQEFQEFVAEMEQGIEEMKTKPNQVVAKLDLYTDSKTEAMFLQAELIEEEVPFALLSFKLLPGQDKHDMHFSLLFSQGEEPVSDWAALRADIIAGTNAEGVLVEVTAVEEKNMADNKHLVNTRMNLFLMGLNIGFAVDNSSSLTGKYESQSSFAISFFSPQPLITIHVSESETDEALPQRATDGFEEVLISEEMSEEDGQLLMNKLEEAVPALLEKLNVALPEEGPMLTMLLNSAMTEATDELEGTEAPQPMPSN